MRIDGQRTDPGYCGHIAQMRAKAFLVDRKVFKKRQQDSGNYAARFKALWQGHEWMAGKDKAVG
jgi:hypothetical protein